MAGNEESDLTTLQRLNLGLRALMETGIVLGLAYWGYHWGGSRSMKFFWCIVTPLAGFGFWGAVDFRGMGRVSELLRLIQELLVSGLASLALYMAGAYVLAIALASISIIHHVFVYSLGERLLKK